MEILNFPSPDTLDKLDLEYEGSNENEAPDDRKFRISIAKNRPQIFYPIIKIEIENIINLRRGRKPH